MCATSRSLLLLDLRRSLEVVPCEEGAEVEDDVDLVSTRCDSQRRLSDLHLREALRGREAAADAGYLHAFGSEDLTYGLDEVRIDADSCDGGDVLGALEVIDRGDELSNLLLGIGTGERRQVDRRVEELLDLTGIVLLEALLEDLSDTAVELLDSESSGESTECLGVLSLICFCHQYVGIMVESLGGCRGRAWDWCGGARCPAGSSSRYLP